MNKPGALFLFTLMMVIPLIGHAQSTTQNNSTNQSSQEQAPSFGYNPATPPAFGNSTNAQNQVSGQDMPNSMMPTFPTAMLPKTMVATSDGGAIIAIGGKLIKYDENLNVVKEVDIKVDNSNSTNP